MNKQELLQEITALSKEGHVSREEVLGAYDAGIALESGFSARKETRFGLAEIMNYLGGGIVAIGIGILLSENWDDLSAFTRILSTLGSGALAYVIGVMLSRDAARATLGQAFHLIAAVVLPIGLFVTSDEMGADISESSISSLVLGSLFVLYLISYRLFSGNLFLFVSGVFGTGLFLSMTSWIAEGSAISFDGDFAAYQFLVIGLVYVLLGHDFSKKSAAPLTKYLYSFGLFFFFIAALFLGGYAPDQNIFWEIVFPGLALGAVFLSLPLRSRAFLIIGTGSLVVYIFKITGEYFADSLGWPLALIVAGFGMIAVGSLFVRLNKRYKALD